MESDHQEVKKETKSQKELSQLEVAKRIYLKYIRLMMNIGKAKLMFQAKLQVRRVQSDKKKKFSKTSLFLSLQLQGKHQK